MRRLTAKLLRKSASQELRTRPRKLLSGEEQHTLALIPYVFGADEPEELGGTDTGPNQFEMLAASLGRRRVVPDEAELAPPCAA